MEIDGPPDDVPVESSSSPVAQSKGDLGNPINNSSEPTPEQQLSPSRKRKLGDEEAAGIAPHEPALKVLHVEERHGDQNRDHQSDLIASAQLVVDDSAAIEFKESFMNPHQSHLEALLVGEDRSDDFNNDSLSALRVYAGVDESPSPGEDEYPTVSFSNALEPTLEGLQQSQEVPLADVDNALSASPLPDLKVLENRAEDGTDAQSEMEAPGVVEFSPKDESQMLVSDFQPELQAPHVGETHSEETQLQVSDPKFELDASHVVETRLKEAQLQVSDPKFELEAPHVLENRVEDVNQLRVSDPPLELDALCRDDQTGMHLDDPQPELEALQVEQSDSQPQLEPLYVEEHEPRPQLEPLLVEEGSPQSELEALHVEESNVQPEFEAMHVEENSVQPEFEALRVVASEAVLVIQNDPQVELEALPVKESEMVDETQLRLDDRESEMGPLNAMESALQDETIVSRSDPQTELGALNAAESAVDEEDIGSLSDPQAELGALNASESAGDEEDIGSISDSQTELGALNPAEGGVEDEAIVSVIDPQTELEALPVVEDGVEGEGKVCVIDPQSELAVLPLVENLGESETKVSASDPRPELEAMPVEESAAGQDEAVTVQDVSDPSTELDFQPMEIENSGDDESQSAAKKRKLVLLAAVAAFFSTLAGALGSIGELVGQLEKTAMAGVSIDRDGHLERTAMVGMTSTSTSSPSPLGESTAVRLHSAMTRSSSSLHNNIIVSMFLLMQQHRKRSQKRPRELTGPWYIKPRSAQAFESFLDFSPQGDPEKFRELFRISPSLFFHICEMVRDEMLSDTPRSLRVLPNRVLTVERQVAIAIRRLATGNQFLGIADSIGVSKSTAVKVTWKFIVAFIKKARSQHLQWPNREQMQRIKDGFKNQWGFPNCCGVVDGTHFTVEFPKGEDVSQYYDHQNHVSISMQAIVGHDQRFLDVVVGWPGSVQEYQLLQNTNFFRTVANTKERLNGEAYITQDGSSLREYILGDAGYPLYDWLMVPYPSGLSAAKDEWNSRHAVAKQCVEDALVRLKGTWKILSRILWKPRKERIGKMVFACCLLHNMIIERQDGLSPDVYAGVNPHPGGYTGVSIPTEEVFEGGPEARDVLFREVMGGGIV